jgi:hypothetical protein
MSLVQNEQRKLTANYLNSLAVTIFAMGTVSPFISAFVNGIAANHIVSLIVSIICFPLSVAIHFVARALLKGLKP